MVTFLCSTPLMCRNGEFRALTRIDKVFTHGDLHEREKGHMIPREAEKSSGSYEKKILLSRWYIQREKRRFICKKTSDIPGRKGSGPV